jgi:hypothetical protein
MYVSTVKVATDSVTLTVRLLDGVTDSWPFAIAPQSELQSADHHWEIGDKNTTVFSGGRIVAVPNVRFQHILRDITAILKMLAPRS